MTGFERFERQQEREDERLLIEKAYGRAQKEIARDAINPDTREFRARFGDAEVDRDLRYVSNNERLFKQDSSSSQGDESRKIGTIFEAIFHDQAELSDWLGPDAITIKTSRYDDILFGIDSVVERQHDDEASSFLGVAIDVASGIDLDRKFRRIKDEVQQGELGHVKYFDPERMGTGKEFLEIPRAVIGASRETIRELAELWLNKDNKALAAHPIQFQILEELELQFAALRSFAERVRILSSFRFSRN